MNTRALVMLGLAVGLGGLAVVTARSLIQPPPVPVAAKPEPPKHATVVVAASALPFGKPLTAADLREAPWPLDGVPPGAFSSIAEVTRDGPRVVLGALTPGEPVLTGKLSAPGARAALSMLVAADKRAMTVRVNDVNGVAGFVLPGDRVDLLLTRQTDPKFPVTDLLLQNIKVLAVDQQVEDRKEMAILARAVTLEVTPEEGQKLTLGATIGSLSLSLRNLADGAAADPRTIGLADLGGGLPDGAVAEVPPNIVRVVRGAKVEDVQVAASITVTRPAASGNDVTERPAKGSLHR
ncbi:Flp pilus assembly protein CpaB [Azospirillum sp.]|uniref:Flp pilus assembly protein CpaB n=1 Tax=Azospirillum sp. TaxID=34012 RepID=UPI002D36B9BB|nr:Flp pilus assembly protein CpaB [Azospirillum sp.]HYD66413.1 Flp pilus assembly protein CpaB [Azospirillum sp.]